MMNNSKTREKVSKRHKPRSSPNRGSTSPKPSLGEVYLDTFNPPALASTSDLYREVYASVRAILERYKWRDAPTAVQAAWDAAASFVTQSLVTGGGPGR